MPADLYELLERQLAVHVLVHLSEDLVRPLLGGRLVLRHLHHGTHLGSKGLIRSQCSYRFLEPVIQKIAKDKCCK